MTITIEDLNTLRNKLKTKLQSLKDGYILSIPDNLLTKLLYKVTQDENTKKYIGRLAFSSEELAKLGVNSELVDSIDIDESFFNIDDLVNKAAHDFELSEVDCEAVFKLEDTFVLWVVGIINNTPPVLANKLVRSKNLYRPNDNN